MVDLIKRVIDAPSKLIKLLSINPIELEAQQYLKKTKQYSKFSADIVLVQTSESLSYFGLFGLIVNSISKHKPVYVHQFVLSSLALGESASLKKLISSRCVTSLRTKKWIGFYSAFTDGVAYHSSGFQSPISDAVHFYRAFLTWRNLSTKEDIINLMIDDVPVGDLVNDSFLRFKPAATVNIQDIYLLIVIWQAYRDIKRAKKYFSNVKPKLYLTSFTTYIQHGIAVRVALMNGIRVISFGSNQEFAKELTLQDWFQTKNTDSYAEEFTKLTDVETKLALSEAALNARISGVIDNATSYMKQSAYAETTEQVPDVKGAVVVFLHDFYDSPHIYPDMVFPDFWEWICFTIEVLSRANIKFVIKPHPNQINLSDSVLVELNRRYPSITLISSKITNKQLVNAGVACAVTVYGTVAHEMAYMGVPTIASARHPHISFEFCKTAKTKHEYAELLKNFYQCRLSVAEMKRQSLAFYYMHNLNLNNDEKELIDALSRLRQLYGGDENKQIENQVNLFEEISRCTAFSTFISRLI